MTDLALFGTDLFGEVVRPKASGPVAERFTLPPFTLLDARSGAWQERKRAWLSMGFRSEVGRLENSLGMSDAASLEKKIQAFLTRLWLNLLCAGLARQAAKWLTHSQAAACAAL